MGNQPPSFKCPYCAGQITFTRWTSVLRHCRNQHPEQEEPKKEMRASLKVLGNANDTRKRSRGTARKKNVNRSRGTTTTTTTTQAHTQRNYPSNKRRRIAKNELMAPPPMNIMPSV